MATLEDVGGLEVERSDEGWALVAFNRPDRLNTLSVRLRQTLDAVIDRLEADPGVHVLILTGRGRAFSAGLDLDDWGGDAGAAAGAYRWDPVAALSRFSGPVVAAVNGLALTGGLEIVLACDVVLAAETARFADTHVQVGLLPGWGGSVRLIDRVGLHRAKELALTGRFFSAEEAERWGVVNGVVPDGGLLGAARDLARQMLRNPPDGLVAYKRLLNGLAGLSVNDGLVHERARSVAHNTPVDKATLLARLDRLRATRQP